MNWLKNFHKENLIKVEIKRDFLQIKTPQKAYQLEKAQRVVVSFVIGLVVLGIIMIYSTSSVRTLKMDPSHYLRRQILWASLGSVILCLFWNTDYRELFLHHKKIILATIFLLVCVLIPGIGSKVNGSRRWIRLGGIGIQPSEFTKLITIIFSASYITLRQKHLSSFKEGFLPAMIPISLITGLIMIEPDLGTAVFVFTTSSIILIVGGMPLRHFTPFILTTLPVALVGMYFRFSHIKARLLVFLYPDLDPLRKGHQIRQSLIALGSGGTDGLGIGASRQKLFFLPENHTDFILAVIGEELGFIGCVLVILCFLGILFYGKKIMNMAPDLFGHLLAFGIIFGLSFQGLMNIAVVTASMPTKGISLPFVSFGGSSMICSMAGIGILLNIAKTRKNEL